ncbi:DNA polymerase thumb domain-containing protein [Jeotgalibacillus salarius]|uniref:UV damage repair protein UvrX n=1 Tax=Jeotgalibacillus salarius TaxID=546023 RepID=A0A4Y8LNY7_9BACL|nr:UV damage repair protein UvrX [Jeotgalibacillus salarius]TFE03151.1 UV damage repair protein UvrX [Jeotgalibacillus salarius]
MDYASEKHQRILCVDMRSFYASCTAVETGQDPLKCKIAIVGNQEQKGSVILAASPLVKKEFGVRTGSRLHEIPNRKDIQLIEPDMGRYLQLSTEITKLFSRYVPKEAIHVYSVDESFLQIDGTSRLWGDAREIATLIADDMMREFGLPCAVGIGPNMLLAKLCLDMEAKRKGVAEWTYEDVETKLWPVSPLSAMWGIGSRLEKKLNRMGIFSVGDLAAYDLERLEAVFGVMGNQLYYHAHGIDRSEIGAPILKGQVSYGKSQILMRDYTDRKEIEAVLLEMCEEVARRARRHFLAARTVHLGVGYSKRAPVPAFHRSQSIEKPTAITMELYKVCLNLLDQHLAPYPVRKISISLTNLSDDSTLQLDLFNPRKKELHMLGYVMDSIRERHGSASLLRAVSYTDAGTSRRRAALIGGHKSKQRKKAGE